LRSLVTDKRRQCYQISMKEEFAFNNLVNKRTGKSPFEIVYGIQPRWITKLIYLNQDKFRSAGAKNFATEMKKLHDRVREQLQDNN
jgi:hypothetical protein